MLRSGEVDNDRPLSDNPPRASELGFSTNGCARGTSSLVAWYLSGKSG